MVCQGYAAYVSRGFVCFYVFPNLSTHPASLASCVKPISWIFVKKLKLVAGWAGGLLGVILARNNQVHPSWLIASWSICWRISQRTIVPSVMYAVLAIIHSSILTIFQNHNHGLGVLRARSGLDDIHQSMHTSLSCPIHSPLTFLFARFTPYLDTPSC